MTTVLPGPDQRLRCRWCLASPRELVYHDEEWGFPVADDRRLFEKLCLEGFQAGLSWRTILDKREHFRAAFAGFDIGRVAGFGPADVERLLQDSGIVRHRGKIEAAIHNARCAQALIAEQGSLAAYVWAYEAAPEPSEPSEPSESPESLLPRSTSAAAGAMARDLKRRGWKFVGPTTVYAFMQAMGLVNDHAERCVVRAAAAQARQRFSRPENAAHAAKDAAGRAP
jgi:DNA-3-methyladenine glycosylase I